MGDATIRTRRILRRGRPFGVSVVPNTGEDEGEIAMKMKVSVDK
jgi:hypothetical protein